jgi:hypothetical protein
MRGIPTELELQALTNVPISADSALLALTLKAIYTAAQAGSTVTASISVSGALGPQTERLFNDLQAQGLTVTNSGSTFTVGW